VLTLEQLDDIERRPCFMSGVRSSELAELVAVYRIALAFGPLQPCDACGEPRGSHDRSAKCAGFECPIPF